MANGQRACISVTRVGDFWKFLATIFFNKSSLNIWWHLGLSWKMWLLFWQLLEIEPLFIPTFHTALQLLWWYNIAVGNVSCHKYQLMRNAFVHFLLILNISVRVNLDNWLPLTLGKDLVEQLFNLKIQWNLRWSKMRSQKCTYELTFYVYQKMFVWVSTYNYYCFLFHFKFNTKPHYQNVII